MPCDGVLFMAKASRDTAVIHVNAKGPVVTAKKVGGIFSLQGVSEGVETVQKGLEAEGKETDELSHSESAGALATSSDCLQGILCKLFTKAQGLNYGGVSNH